MKIAILQKPKNMLDILYTGARTCYSSKTPTELFTEAEHTPTDKKVALINKVFSRNHLSVAEHVNITFAVEGVSRALLAQLSRHRVGIALSVQSQRYVEIKESQKELEDLYLSSTENYEKLYEILNKYFVDGDKLKNVNGFYSALDNYLEAIKSGEKAEDARRFLPNATRTNLTLTLNLRELMHICNERLCTKAQGEIRQMVKIMRDLLVEEEPWLNSYLQPKCVKNGKCSEEKGCLLYLNLHTKLF